MTERVAPTSHEFEDRFRDEIRVGFNWDRFLSERWPIERVALTTYADLGRCFAPWYVGKTGDEVPYDDPDAVPMSLHDVPKAFEILGDVKRADIQEKIDELRKHPPVVEFTVPSYGLPDGGYFILDRNHRLSALTLSGVQFHVDLWNVHGPFEKDCLLDLHHWLEKEDG